MVTQKLINEFLLDFFYFPIWWFSKGLFQILEKAYLTVVEANKRIAPFLWFKNLFVPMFGQTDIQGKITSFFIRLINGLIRTFLMFLFIWLMSFLVIIWIVFPFVALYFFLNSLGLL